MNIIVPFNTSYLCDRYSIDNNFLDLLKDEVLPDILARLSSDERVDTIEIITDSDIKHITEASNKVIFNSVDIGNYQSANEVVKKILEYRLTNADIVVQLNVLYPFVSIDSVSRGYKKVQAGIASSAIGSFTNSIAETNDDFIERGDLGIFSVYKESLFKLVGERASAPVEMIGMKASELICLRSKVDLRLFELIVNSGYEI